MPEEVTPEVVETPAVEPAAEVVETPPAAAAGPWSADLAEYFGENAEAIAAADRYMREKVQPRMTELESHPGRELWKDINDDAQSTLIEIAEEVFGEEKGKQFRAIFEAEEAAAPEAEDAKPDEADLPDWAKPMVDDYQTRRDTELRAQRDAEYAEAKAGMKVDHPDLRDADIALIDPFIASANGDLEAAYAAYKTFADEFKAAHGVTPAQAEAAAPAPAVLGTTGAAATPPPVAPKYDRYDQLGDAVSDWFAESKAGEPPPVI